MDRMASGPGRSYRDGVLGALTAVASGPGRTYRDGVLGALPTVASGAGRTYRDGVLGSMAMASGPGRSFQDGVLGGCAGCGLGELNQSAYQDGVLGDYLQARNDGVLGEIDFKNPVLWAGVGVAAIGAFLLLKPKKHRANRRRKRKARRR